MVFTAVKYSTKLHLRYQIKKNNQKIGFCFCKRFFFVWSGIYSGSETDGIKLRFYSFITPGCCANQMQISVLLFKTDRPIALPGVRFVQ